MTAMTNDNNSPGRAHSRPRITVKPGHLIIGIVLVLLAVGSVLSSHYAVKRQNQLVACGSAVVAQTITALHARDAAQLESNKNSIAVTEARQVALDALFDAAEHKKQLTTAELETIRTNYNQAVNNNVDTINNFTRTIQAAPAPTLGCLK
jgi:hypothetical protein